MCHGVDTADSAVATVRLSLDNANDEKAWDLPYTVWGAV